MRNYMKSKSAIMSTEIMLGITLVVIAVFAVLGAFDKGVSGITNESSIKGTYQNSVSEKTNYKKYNKDYSNSLVNANY